MHAHYKCDRPIIMMCVYTEARGPQRLIVFVLATFFSIFPIVYFVLSTYFRFSDFFPVSFFRLFILFVDLFSFLFFLFRLFALPMQINWTRHWMKLAEWSRAVWRKRIPTVCPYSPESPHLTPGERWQVVRNGHGKSQIRGTHSTDIL